MTIMGLDYLKHKETQRSNMANERETHRSNLANETERNRSNLANEAETKRSNLAREAETNRSNLAREYETNRSNVQNELLKNQDLRIKLQDVLEKARHNARSENLDSLRATISALPPGVKETIGTGLALTDPTLSAAWDKIKGKSTDTMNSTVDKVSNWLDKPVDSKSAWAKVGKIPTTNQLVTGITGIIKGMFTPSQNNVKLPTRPIGPASFN